MFLRFRFGFVSLGLAAALSGCFWKKPSHSETDAINNRPQNLESLIAIIKLPTPALLTDVAVKDGKRVVVDAEARSQAIAAEQDQLLKDLAALSSEVKVIYRYRMVLNAVAVSAPRSLEPVLRAMASVSYIEGESPFSRPATEEFALGDASGAGDLTENNSAAFIGALKVQRELKVKNSEGLDVPVDGRGIRVGVIDTGIDYTHAMFGGAGTAEAYKAINPAEAAPAGSYPNAKVVGGIDLVGTDFNSASVNFAQHIPLPDANPIDEAGHGSHVAGTIAGLGDGKVSYNGVAPEALLYAIKVFGKDGSTSDSVVLAALEYAADPTQDLDLSDQLNVVNLSLGSGFGSPRILYNEAIHTLVGGGTSVVCSAGNSGDVSYIVGAPSTSDDAISVAASVDNMDHNFKFRAVSFTAAGGEEFVSEAIEASFTKPIADAGDVRGELVPVGLADVDFPDEVKAKVAGKVALIDRGKVTFNEKIVRAEAAGAIGVVVVNNNPGEPISMGGEATVKIPAIMIKQALGQTFKDKIAKSEAVSIAFFTDKKIDKPELIDTLTSFSSRGPRSVDSAIKPEVAAPGANVISSKMGSGNETVKFSGTSMAAPHMAGVVALLAQARADLSPLQLKSLVVNTAKSIKDAKGETYSVVQQGAGRVEAFTAASASLVLEPATLSLGEVLVEKAKTLRRELKLKNISGAPLTLTLAAPTTAGLAVSLPASVTLAAGETKTLALEARVSASALPAEVSAAALEGSIVVKSGDVVLAHAPVLAVVRKLAKVEAKALLVHASSASDAPGAAVDLKVKNSGPTAGRVELFNLLALDQRSPFARQSPARNILCDMQSAGVRVVEREVEGKKVQFLQVAVKLYNSVTTWNLCQVSVQFDANGDGVAEQELLGGASSDISPQFKAGTFNSILTDAKVMRDLRAQFEKEFPKSTTEDYAGAVVDAQEFTASSLGTLAIVTADLSKVAKAANGDVHVKVAMLQSDSQSPLTDDFLAKQDTDYARLTLSVDGLAYVGMPEGAMVAAGESATVALAKGQGLGRLVVYMPDNASTSSMAVNDQQQAVPKAKFDQ